ncbi:MAG: putative bifunctional diguanylate cyclase/phosphodiesterase [Paracoccaceae bacterium]
MLAFLPALCLGAFWFGGEQALVLTALGLPAVLAIAPVGRNLGACGLSALHDHGLSGCDLLVATLDDAFGHGPRGNNTGGSRSTICFSLRVEDLAGLAERFGKDAVDRLLNQTADRLAGALREIDVVARLDDDSFAVALAPVLRADLESALQVATRLQAAAEAPLSIDAATVYVNVSVGLCLGARAPERSGAAMLRAARLAMVEASRNGPGALRCYTPDMEQRAIADAALGADIAEALENGQIIAWFQPQLSTDTGQVSGFEALARWQHPVAGTLPPADFLPAVHNAGLSSRLGEIMVTQALTALRDWDRAGITVPTVAVNFSMAELSDPRLAEKLKWELDRFGLMPERLTVEILESVAADTGNEIVVRNVAALAALGCGIDLDDFGTGHASIANIRRLAVRRIKIDRSFVTRLDMDQNQQKMVAAVISMADRLGLDTLAEGVETTGEHSILAQLGCRHVQGYGPGAPMPFADTLGWLARHRARLAEPPRLINRA